MALSCLCWRRVFAARQRYPLDSPSPPHPPPPAHTLPPAHPTHTRSELLRDPSVKFVGYRHPHPLENDILLRVQTSAGVSTTAALSGAAKRLEGEFRVMSTQLVDELRKVEEERQRLDG